MTTYTDVFGGANIYPSDISYSFTTLTTNLTLSWPEETSASANYATRIMDVSAAVAGWSLTLPDATGAGTGETILFNNVGSQNFTVRNNAGTQLVVLSPGELWQVYLAANTTSQGVWRVLQYGVGSSSVDASSLAGAGLVAVGTLLSTALPVTTFNSSYTAGASDRATLFAWTGAGGTITLPTPTSVGAGWVIGLRNSGSGAIVADPAGGVTIDSSLSKSFQPGDSAIITTDGSVYYTIGFGQDAVFAFDYTSIAVPGSGAYTLSGTELNRISYSFTGVLTGSRQVIVPATVQQYWVGNDTTGPYTLEIKTSAGTGVLVNQGARAILLCDGNNVLNASTAGLSLPISILQGGTGATTASAARINLGATSVGDALYTAASQAAAYAALGIAPAGVVNGGTF